MKFSTDWLRAYCQQYLSGLTTDMEFVAGLQLAAETLETMHKIMALPKAVARKITIPDILGAEDSAV